MIEQPPVLRKKPGEKILNAPLSLFGQSNTGQLYFIQISQCFLASAIPAAYQMASDRLAPRVSAPILQEVQSQYYISTRMTLELYHSKILQERKLQIQAIQERETREKLIALADGAVGVLSLVLPYTRIGNLLVTSLGLTMAELAVHVAKGMPDSKEATDAILYDGILELMFKIEELKKVMPSWVEDAFEVKEKVAFLFTGKEQEEKKASSIPRVAADDILDRIYRFRCIVDPTLPKQIETALRNNQRLMASILAWR